ncbi:Hypothetical predicted protein [Olea europaea subsp. europaea]|uniref:Uncharacterized protein n=1 Tax=Olea europaea subsp. europaea TaxID=158383 RepID=A0A8S0RDC2_OLEEU|nr:Hypothetical predicted protein [Olea europaea subsp. europaea]
MNGYFNEGHRIVNFIEAIHPAGCVRSKNLLCLNISTVKYGLTLMRFNAIVVDQGLDLNMNGLRERIFFPL